MSSPGCPTGTCSCRTPPRYGWPPTAWTTGWPANWPNSTAAPDPPASERAGAPRSGADHGVLDEGGGQLPVRPEDVPLTVAATVPGERAPLLQEVPVRGGAALVVRQRVAQHAGRERPVRLGLADAG